MKQYLKRLWGSGAAEMIAVAAAVLFSILALGQLFQNSQHFAVRQLERIDDGWYISQDGARQSVAPGDELAFGGDGTVTVYNDSLSARQGVITTDAAVYRIGIFWDGREIYRYDDSAFPCNEQMRAKIHCDAMIPADGTENTLSITYHSTGAPTFRMPQVRCGTTGDVLMDHISQEAFTLGIIAVMLLCGMASIAVAIYLSTTHMPDRRFLDITSFLVLCSIWCFCDSGLARYISRMSAGVEGLAFYSFMTLAIPMVHFVVSSGQMKSRISLRVVLGLFYGNVVLQTLLWLLGGVDFIDMLLITHILLAGGVVVCVAELIHVYRKNGDPQLKSQLLAFAAVGSSGVLALLLYWAFSISFYAVIFELGILLFILMMFSNLCAQMVENLRFKTESKIYERLSHEDVMTGLQNRRGFDEYIQHVIENREEGENVRLIFLDINGLKVVNDRYGHRAGDEMIVGAAQCLKNTFEGFGRCFRLGGDEFCVIIPGNPSLSGMWEEALQEALNQYNQCHRVQVSMAGGSSMLLDEEGTVRTLSDWKQRADLEMYDNKKKMKLSRAD